MENILSYANSLNINSEVSNWLNTVAKAALRKKQTTESELEHVLDYLVSGKAPTRLQKLSIKDAKRLSNEWSKSNQKKGKNLTDSEKDIETVHDFLDGTRIVRLKTKRAFQREGFLMNHCVGGYSVSDDVLIYSYRDKNNNPHATFEVRKQDQEILQIKGKGNGEIHPKYIHPILTFLKSIGMDIRPSEMQNLGYYHVDKSYLDFLKTFPQIEKQLIIISGECYAF
jgi:hypothetical protein